MASWYVRDSYIHVSTTKLVRCVDKTKAMLVSARQTIIDLGLEPYKEPLRYCDGPFLAHLVLGSHWRKMTTTLPGRFWTRMAHYTPSARASFLSATWI